MEVSVVAFGVEVADARGKLNRRKYSTSLLRAGLLSSSREDLD
jgi:hypothetical protein